MLTLKRTSDIIIPQTLWALTGVTGGEKGEGRSVGRETRLRFSRPLPVVKIFCTILRLALRNMAWFRRV